MSNVDPARSVDVPAATRRSPVDWGAIFAGTVIAAGLTIVLTTFAGALGLSSITAEPGESVSFFGLVLTGLFTAISTVAVYMLGGYVAGRLRADDPGVTAEESATRDGLHGLVVWGIGLIVAGAFALSAASGTARIAAGAAATGVQAAGSVIGGVAQGAGQIAGGAISGVGQAAGGAAQAAGPSLEEMLPQGLRANPVDYLTDSLLRADGGAGNGQQQDPAAAERRIAGVLANVVRTGEISDADRAAIRDVAASRTGLPPEQVDARVNEGVERAKAMRAEAQKRLDDVKAQAERLRAEAETQAQQAKDQALAAAEKARVAAVLTAFLLAASALAAGAAAFIGAVRGGEHRDRRTIWRGLSYRARP
ncbi:hypothetical protein [Methylopila turkensis]|uniref:PhnA-like protein n=1 Tax=Methylopila turkensis TaxID=1437816 RepID=A0A9W6JQ87_9HYPH|nr:hypothetical protein [Methylopila turkensis]GLK80418.1 hypothetical protein GCM10008174_21590 [Methylopila turkensis]